MSSWSAFSVSTWFSSSSSLSSLSASRSSIVIRISSIFWYPRQHVDSARVGRAEKHLAKEEITLGELDEHVLCGHCVVELELEVFNLRFGISEFAQGRVILRCKPFIKCVHPVNGR